jgi:hypothetical protein
LQSISEENEKSFKPFAKLLRSYKQKYLPEINGLAYYSRAHAKKAKKGFVTYLPV